MEYLSRVEVAGDRSPMQRRSAASVDTVHGSSRLQKEMDDAHMIGAGSPGSGRGRGGERGAGWMGDGGGFRQQSAQIPSARLTSWYQQVPGTDRPRQ